MTKGVIAVQDIDHLLLTLHQLQETLDKVLEQVNTIKQAALTIKDTVRREDDDGK